MPDPLPIAKNKETELCLLPALALLPTRSCWLPQGVLLGNIHVGSYVPERPVLCRPLC